MIAQSPTNAASTYPTAQVTQSISVCVETASLTSSRQLISITGMPRMKEYFTDVSLFMPEKSPAEIVEPDLETPGSSATP